MLEQVAAEREPAARTHWPWGMVWTLSLFALLWAVFFVLYRRFPYLETGSDVVFGAKLRWEATGPIFPADPGVVRVLIFGNSKILAGFMPSIFDQTAATHQLKVSSFNSGFPGSDLVLAPLETMCARAQAPNILLLTLPLRPDPPRRTLFRFIQDDHAVIERLFPFRNLARDLSNFFLRAPSHGGVAGYYREAEQAQRDAIAQRGYYLISEQSDFPGGRLPDDFHVSSDQPDTVLTRSWPRLSQEITQLNQIIQQYHIHCYYVPFYLRIGEAAAAPGYDQPFANSVQQATPCQVIGPDYYLYPNKFFSDQTHLNRAGAQVYTKTLFQLVETKLHPAP